jgi:hypothetical protein
MVNNKAFPVKENGSFSGNITLFEGDNKVVVQARSASGATTTVTRQVSLDSSPPMLTISQPTSNFDMTLIGTCDSRNCYIQVFGLTEPGVSLSINGVNVSRYIEDDGSFFIQDFPVRRTERTLTFEAEDMLRQRTVEVLYVAPPSDIDFDGAPDTLDACPSDPSCQ